jgi:hypothetical protein
MAFTATIDSINFDNDMYVVSTTFADSATGFSSRKTYNFPVGTTRTAAVNQITSDGTAIKGRLTALNTLRADVGTVIEI